MGQFTSPPSPASLILTADDRLQAINAGGGVSPLASHIILMGVLAGHNLGALTDIIALGENAFAGGAGGNVDNTLNGSIVIGGNAVTGNLTTAGSGQPFASIVIGRNALRLANGGASANVILGDGALENGVGDIGGGGNYSANVVLGVQAGQNILFANGAPLNANVILGFRAARGGIGATSAISTVIIGSGACIGYTNSIDNSVVIGAQAAPAMHGGTNSIIGFNAGSSAGSGASNVLLGAGTNFRNGDNNVVIGAASAVLDGANNVILGARIGAIQAASDCVIIGNQAGVFTGLTDVAGQFLIEQNGSTMVYGKFYGASGGSCVFGNSVAANRTLPGTNTLGLMNGTVTGNPVGGGLFYGVGGELRWRNVTGLDTLITPGAGFTVATLPATANLRFVGQRTYVTDALAPAFGAVVAAGGAVTIPVFWNGANWIVG